MEGRLREGVCVCVCGVCGVCAASLPYCGCVWCVWVCVVCVGVCDVCAVLDVLWAALLDSPLRLGRLCAGGRFSVVRTGDGSRDFGFGGGASARVLEHKVQLS